MLEQTSDAYSAPALLLCAPESACLFLAALPVAFWLFAGLQAPNTISILWLEEGRSHACIQCNGILSLRRKGHAAALSAHSTAVQVRAQGAPWLVQ